MLKKILISLLFLYVLGTAGYFILKETPKNSKEEEKKEKALKDYVNQDECESYAIGHIAINEFRVPTRFVASADEKKAVLDTGDMQEALRVLTCDRAMQKALIYYDSKPVAIARVERFDYSKPLAQNSELKTELYTVLRIEKKLADFPNNGYVIAVYNFKDDLMDFYNNMQKTTDDNDEKTIAGSCDTIYYQTTGTDPYNTEISYSALKGALNNYGLTVLSTLAMWKDPNLPKDVQYTAVFNLHIMPDGSAKRFSLFPITKTRNSTFHTFQVLDLNNDGYKETVIRKSRDSQDSFIIYYFDINESRYLVMGDQEGE